LKTIKLGEEVKLEYKDGFTIKGKVDYVTIIIGRNRTQKLCFVRSEKNE